MEEAPKTIYITNRDELDKLNVTVSFDKVEYSPTVRASVAVIKLSLVFPNTIYTYGGNLRMSGDARSSIELRCNFKELNAMQRLLDVATLRANKELSSVKDEIANILNAGVKRVALDMEDTLQRLLQQVRVATERVEKG